MGSTLHFNKAKLVTLWLAVSVLLNLLSACNPFLATTSLEKIQKRGDIIMGTINSSLTYSYDGTNYSGFDYELSKQFAHYLDVKLTIKEYDTLNALFNALDSDEIDFIGSGLTLTPKRAKKYRSSPPYYYVSQKVVYHKGTYRPRKIADINEPISVLKDSSHEETLESLSAEAPELEINILDNEDQETLLRWVAEKEIKFAIVDSSTLAQKQRYYPVLAEAFTISEKQPVAWLIKRHQDDTLYSAMIGFMGNKYQDKSIDKLEEKYFGHVAHFDFVDTRTFLKRIKSTLPKYEALFKEYATKEVDWLLLAAVSYQESHWNPKAKSPTGVRGLMMLTLNTAKHVGIRNRLDPIQSIQGGAKYLSQLINRLPDSVTVDEKAWFALASYNIGYGHLMDARRITSMKEQNPDSWSDVKDNLPLLHQKQWYKKVRYGYARGREAQHYVNNIRQYRKTLTWFIAEREKAQQAAKDKALAEKVALKDAQEKALLEKINLPTPLSREQALRLAKQKTSEEDKTLQQAINKTIATQRALQQAREKTAAQEKTLTKAKERAFALQQALQKAKNKALAEEKILQESQAKALAEQKSLLQAKDQAITELEAYQEAKDKALAEQQSYQQAKDKAVADQQLYQKAKDQALREQKILQEAKEAQQLPYAEKA